MPLPENLVQQFHHQGYLVLERAIPDQDLIQLNEECEHSLDAQIGDMERVGAETLGLSQKEKRYFLPGIHEERPVLEQFLFGDQMQDLVSSLVGDNAFLFVELFVVKWPRTGGPFAWHQDSGYLLGNPHKPYVAFWCALNEMTEENGCLRVLPGAGAGPRVIAEHTKDPTSGDFVGYEGDDQGIAVPVPPGSIIALHSTTFHCSGPNVTEAPRKALLASYSPEPITDKRGQLWDRAVPFMKDGKRVFEFVKDAGR
jgi:ectoine hydroxylase-related dioxygenase (phytanoyl-CoA dioxygenase family)